MLQIAGDRDAATAIAAVGSHMNPAGIFVRLADPPRLGARVRVTLDAEGTEGVLTATGTVVSRVDGEEITPERPPGAGICLEQIGPAWTKLYEWLAEAAE
jgi:hypothetical protein